jgi:hypothetical protein
MELNKIIASIKSKLINEILKVIMIMERIKALNITSPK